MIGRLRIGDANAGAHLVALTINARCIATASFRQHGAVTWQRSRSPGTA